MSLPVDIGGEEGSAEFRFQSDDSFHSFLFRRFLHELDSIQFGRYSVFIGTQESVCSNTFSNNKKRETFFQATKQNKKKENGNFLTWGRMMLNANMSNGLFMLRCSFIYCLLYFPSVLFIFCSSFLSVDLKLYLSSSLFPSDITSRGPEASSRKIRNS